jgi:hypothetical protein
MGILLEIVLASQANWLKLALKIPDLVVASFNHTGPVSASMSQNYSELDS